MRSMQGPKKILHMQKDKRRPGRHALHQWEGQLIRGLPCDERSSSSSRSKTFSAQVDVPYTNG